MVVVLTLMLSLLLVLARVHADGIHGLGHWAFGNLAIGIGMLVIMTQFQGPQWAMIPGTALIGLGNGLYINGIQAFRDRQPDYRIPAILVLAVLLLDNLLLLVLHDIRLTVFSNALLYMLANLVCARMLLVRMPSPLRTAYWFTGVMFLVMAIILAIRAIAAVLAEPAVFDAMSTWPINKLTLFGGAIFQLCATFGFVLMLNYSLVNRMHLLAAEDWLTGALTRRSLEDAAIRMEANCQRFNLSLAMLLIDLDHFKEVNDRHGHQFGDEVLAAFAGIVRSMIRAGDLFGRYGGEEFCILLPNTDESEAKIQAERIRAAFEAGLKIFQERPARCTISIGVCELSQVGTGFNQLFAAADAALYEAKKRGRNRVVPYSELGDRIKASVKLVTNGE